jgi:hypothetical protein
LKNFTTIVFRPRFVESGRIQLVGLFAQPLKTLVLYFSYPHAYSYENVEFFSNTQSEYDLTSITDPHYLGTASGDDSLLSIPPLYYIIKMISKNTSVSIDKFLLRLGSTVDSEKLLQLDEISYFYSRLGY